MKEECHDGVLYSSLPLCSSPPLPQEEDGSTGLHHAAKLGNLDIVRLLLGTGQVDVNAQVREGAWPLGSAQVTTPNKANKYTRVGLGDISVL